MRIRFDMSSSSPPHPQNMLEKPLTWKVRQSHKNRLYSNSTKIFEISIMIFKQRKCLPFWSDLPSLRILHQKCHRKEDDKGSYWSQLTCAEVAQDSWNGWVAINAYSKIILMNRTIKWFHQSFSTCIYSGRPLVGDLRRGRRNKRSYIVLRLLPLRHLEASHGWMVHSHVVQ